MCRLPRSAAAWGSDGFADTLKAEVRVLAPAELPLNRLSSTGHALDSQVSVTVIEARERAGSIEVRLGVFFEETLPGCSCGDEAQPRPAYGELALRIERATSHAQFAPIEDRQG